MDFDVDDAVDFVVVAAAKVLVDLADAASPEIGVDSPKDFLPSLP